MNSQAAHAIYLAVAYGATVLLIGIELLVLRAQGRKLRHGESD